MSRHDDRTDPFEALGRLTPPAPDPDARARALAEGLAAFEAANAPAPEGARAQGSGWAGRLKSIVPSLKGRWIMDMRIPLGTAAAALLLFPLGFHLAGSMAFLPPGAGLAERTIGEIMDEASTQILVDAVPPPAPAPLPLHAPTTQIPSRFAAQGLESGRAEGVAALRPPAMLLAPTPSGDDFARFEDSRLKAVADEPVSTFSIDVDTVSYSYVRRMLEEGRLPMADAVRIEEMINYFPYAYPAPDGDEAPFATTLGIHPTPWNPATQLLHIGIRAHMPAPGERAPANLVFLIDTSGSMEAADRLPLLKRAFGLLVEELLETDTVSIVAYAGAAGIVLEPTPASDKARIVAAIERLHASGATGGEGGLELAYRLAEQNRIADGINRVILATDGDFNVGLSDPRGLEGFIRAKRETGVFLSVLGFGTGNLGDATMQALAQSGNGTAAYISNFAEARKVLVEEIGGTLETVAKDVKIQVEFNPARVSEYRLIGYETRALERADFNNDNVDAGEIGAGHTVTALYEITPAGSDGALIDPLRYAPAAGTPEADAAEGAEAEEYAFLRLRYKQPDGDESALYERAVTPDLVYPDLGAAPDDMRFAASVAAFGQKLRGSDHIGAMGWDEIRRLAHGARGPDESGYRAEFVRLVDLAATIR